jgi:RimJ/RimL family protein N-acetyltransferase
VQELQTERLLMRQWRAEDIEPYTRYFRDQNRAQYFGGKRNADDAWRHLAMMVGHWQLNGFGYWAVEERITGTFVGCVGLWKSLDWPELELGYWIDDRQQRKGFAEEAAAECVRYARNSLKSPSLVSYIASDNMPSQKLAAKLGAKYEQTIELVEQGPHLVYRHF